MANATVGDWVLYRLDEGNRPGVWRPALVVDVNADESVDALVFTAGINDGLGYHMRFVHGVQAGDQPGEYHPRADAQPAPDAPDAAAATSLALAEHAQDGTPVYGPYTAEQLAYFARHGFPNEMGQLPAAEVHEA